MTLEQRRLLGSAMAARARQWRTRMALGLFMAGAFFTMTGVSFAIAWLALYACLQLIEVQFIRAHKRSSDWLPSESWSWLAIGFVVLNNFAFGSFAIRQAFGEEDLGVTAAVFVLCGAIVNGLIACAGSRALTWASIGPQIVCLSAVGAAIMVSGVPTLATTQLAVASALFVILAVVASNQLARKLQATEEGKQAAESANVSKSQFLANMSHEIRTPLNGVVSMADLLWRSDLAAPDREMLQIIRASADTLTALLSDILDMARIEAGEVSLESTTFQLGDTIRAACALFTLRAKEKGVALVLDLPIAADRYVVGDGARLRQVLNNLISNAVKFTSAGRVVVTASLVDPARIRVEVSDTGVGFDPLTSGDLFARFQQADGSITRKFGGTGLGLAISRDLVKLMGGDIGYDSVPQSGSKFWFELPFAPGDGDEAVATEAEDVAVHRAMTVLVVDDHPTNLKVATMILEQIGSVCTTAVDGAEAVAAFQKKVFDLILMDMQMPVMDGLTAVRAIRQIEASQNTKRTHIIVLSANAMSEHISAAIDAGADQHLAKPIHPADLISAVAAL